MSGRKQYLQSYRETYSVEFPCIKKSVRGTKYAFCSVCSSDISISHGGKSDITLHLKSQKHRQRATESDKNSKITAFMNTKENNVDNEVIHAECLFTMFLVEHNLPLTAADHAGPLFRKMFPKSEVAKRYGCARTKTAAIIKELSSEERNSIVTVLQNAPFSLAIDGSNDTDAKLHPIVVTYFCETEGKIKSCLLTAINIPSATGKNIACATLEVFAKFSVPFKNCIAFGSDNAPVMLGEKNGVAHHLKQQHSELIIIGCVCHLLNLAANKAAVVLPVEIEQIAIDIFYYLERSANRKESLKKFQCLHDTEIRKILKHVSTRWLSLSRSLRRILEQWEPLLAFFLDEVKKHKSRTKGFQEHSCQMKRKASKESESSKRKCASKLNSEISVTVATKPKKNTTDLKKYKESLYVKRDITISREERIFFFLSSDKNKAFSYFLLYAVKDIEAVNVALQSAAPQIHKLRLMLLELLKNIFLKFLKPAVIKNADLLTVEYHKNVNQKSDSDISIGSAAYEVVQSLKDDEKSEFFISVRKYFLTICDYIIKKFPLDSDILKCAEVADLSTIPDQSFEKIRYFLKKFPFLLKVEDNETESEAWDKLQDQFTTLQTEDLPTEISKDREDIQIGFLRNLRRADGNLKFDKIAHVLLGIMVIPHSNAECERVFSIVKKNRTMFRSSMSDESLENLLVIKCKTNVPCYETSFSNEFLKKAKKATVNNLTDH